MQNFSIRQWALWDLSTKALIPPQPHCYSGQPELPTVPAMVKRRMPAAAKAIQQLNDQHEWHGLPCVYASKHAEISRTFKIIRQFGVGLSPALFSMSVNNAIPGLLSVTNQDTSVYTVIDSMSGVLEMAVTEAVSWLEQHEKVKVVYFEENSPEGAKLAAKDRDVGMVLAMVLEAGNNYQLSISENNDPEHQANISNTNLLGLVELFQGQTADYHLQHNRTGWQWQRKNLP